MRSRLPRAEAIPETSCTPLFCYPTTKPTGTPQCKHILRGAVPNHTAQAEGYNEPGRPKNLTRSFVIRARGASRECARRRTLSAPYLEKVRSVSFMGKGRVRLPAGPFIRAGVTQTQIAVRDEQSPRSRTSGGSRGKPAAVAAPPSKSLRTPLLLFGCLFVLSALTQWSSSSPSHKRSFLGPPSVMAADSTSVVSRRFRDGAGVGQADGPATVGRVIRTPHACYRRRRSRRHFARNHDNNGDMHTRFVFVFRVFCARFLLSRSLPFPAGGVRG